MATATNDVCTIAIYLEDVIRTLRRSGISVATGFMGTVRQAGRELTIYLAGPAVLFGATLTWTPVIGWSLASGQFPPRRWVLPLEFMADPRDVARAIQGVLASLRMPVARA